MLKSEEMANPDSCWNKAGDSELVFVLLGRDKSAPAAVRAWVNSRLETGKNKLEDAQIVEACRWIDAAKASQRAAEETQVISLTQPQVNQLVEYLAELRLRYKSFQGGSANWQQREAFVEKEKSVITLIKLFVAKR